jgi:hypothetical protein
MPVTCRLATPVLTAPLSLWFGIVWTAVILSVAVTE